MASTDKFLGPEGVKELMLKIATALSGKVGGDEYNLQVQALLERIGQLAATDQGLADAISALTDSTAAALTAHNEAPEAHSDIRLAVAEARSIAEGRSRGIVFPDYAALAADLNGADAGKYSVGDHLLILTMEVPDLWVSAAEEEPQTYEYTDDQALVDALAAGEVQIGRYKVSMLEMAKVDLSPLTEHLLNTQNPHHVTAAQAGARPDTWTPTATEVGADPAGTAAGAVSGHNTAPDAHQDIRTELAGKVTTALAAKQNTLKGTKGQFLGFNDQGAPEPQNIETPDVSAQIREHNADETAHPDIRTALTDKADLVGGKVPAAQIPALAYDAKGAAAAVQTALQKTLTDGLAKKADDIESDPVTLTVQGWVDKAQTVAAPHVIADETKQEIRPAPASASMAAWKKAGVLCIAQGEGTVTFSCDTVPETDIQMFVNSQMVQGAGT